VPKATRLKDIASAVPPARRLGNDRIPPGQGHANHANHMF
jgi:hypothetical protein